MNTACSFSTTGSSDTVRGRLFLRQCPLDGKSPGFAIVGVLHFPETVVIEESTPYMAFVGHAGFQVLEPLSDRVIERGEAYEDCVSGWLRAPLWCSGWYPEILVVRFLKAFPDSNGWVAVMATRENPFHDLIFENGDAWVDIDGGTSQAIQAPTRTTGESPTGVLRACAWPDRGGVLHTLPASSSVFRRDLFTLQNLVARRTLGEISQEEYDTAVAARPALAQLSRSIGLTRIETDYALFLARLYQAGRLSIEVPQTASQSAARESVVERIVADLVADERHRSLQNLGREVFPPAG